MRAIRPPPITCAPHTGPGTHADAVLCLRLHPAPPVTRKDFLSASIVSGLGCCALRLLAPTPLAAAEPVSNAAPSAPPSPLQREKDFTDNWLTDLLDTMDAELDEPARARLMEGCGRGCYRRHAFKPAVAAASGGTVEGLIHAYHSICEAWLEGDDLHVRFGQKVERCYCPVLRDRPGRPNDMHCHCTKATHQSIIEQALGRPVRMEIVESVRRGGATCHFVAHLA